MYLSFLTFFYNLYFSAGFCFSKRIRLYFSLYIPEQNIAFFVEQTDMLQ